MVRITSIIKSWRPLLLTAVIATSPAAAGAQGRSSNGPPTRPVTVVAPVDVRDVDNSARRPIQFRLANINADDPTQFTVPNGARLVIEFVSALGSTNEVCSPVSVNVNTTAAGAILSHSFAPSHVLPSPLIPRTNFVVSQPTRLYGDPNTTVSITTVATLTQAGAPHDCAMNQSVSFSGYLVELP